MKHFSVLHLIGAIVVFLLLPTLLPAQVANGRLGGVVTDPSGSAVPNASMTLKDLTTSENRTFTTGPDGNYVFADLLPRRYQLTVAAPGFREYVQTGIEITLNQMARNDVKLELGTAVQTLEVTANASPLVFDTASIEGGVTPTTLNRLPIELGQINRNIASFVALLPGVTIAGGNNQHGFDSRINGGGSEEDEAILDGITVQEGLMSASGIWATSNEHPMSPEAISEFKEITSNYQPQYGTTTAGVLVAVTKSGTNEIHGNVFDYVRNTVFDARQWYTPVRSVNKQNDFGGNIGGPLNWPLFKFLSWTGHKKTYYFVNYEGYRTHGGSAPNILSVPTMQERQGDFSDWKDTNGNLIPIYDPATTQPNPNYNSSLPLTAANNPFTRQQFMGCNGNQPNVICATDPRLVNSLANGWYKFLPPPTLPGLLNNFVALTPNIQQAEPDATLIDVRIDHYVGEKDHFAGTVHYQGIFGGILNQLPLPIDNTGLTAPDIDWMDRFNYDHTFRSNLLNNFNFGWNGTHGWGSNADQNYASVIPQIPGVPSHTLPPMIRFGTYTSFVPQSVYVNMGANGNGGDRRPITVANDTMSWVKGKHTFRFGGEFRAQELWFGSYSNQSGTFQFADINTGLQGVHSGNAAASFLLGQVNNANADIYTVPIIYARSKYYGLHWGDTWKATHKLTIDYGIRWDLDKPSHEKYNHYAFIDYNDPNPDAGNLPGKLVYSGNQWGAASAPGGEQYPEKIDYLGFGPRLGIAYAVTDKTVVRAGYAIVRAKLFMPGYYGGIAVGQDGFNKHLNFTSSDGGITPAFLLQNGMPANYTPPPHIDVGYDNGNAPSFSAVRDPSAGRLPYSMMWNLTISHQFTPNFYVDVGYVANTGHHLISATAAENDLNPRYLSMGAKLYDQFTPGQTSLDGVSAPYTGWAAQMVGCPPTVAQALVPHPQYCGTMQPFNEEAGNSSFNSLQVKAERRMSQGLWFLTSYTLEKWLTNTGGGQAMYWVNAVSSYTRARTKGYAFGDVPQTLSWALAYDLPFGRGKRFLDASGGFGASVINKLVGGWQLSSILRLSSGAVDPVTSSLCNVPPQLGSGCYPGVIPGANPYAQHGGFNPNKPYLNAAAFESPSSMQFYTGASQPNGSVRYPGYYNNDITLGKETRISERVRLGIYAQAFNIWNWHCFTSGTEWGAGNPFVTDINAPNFGMITGVTTNPRNIQLAAKLFF